ncbi:MAG: hypothetical protein AAF078_11600, partial [Planctomycetota bacterium]
MPPALVVARPKHTFLGLPARLDDTLGDRTVLAATLTRLAAAKQVDRIVVVHPASQPVDDLIAPVRESLGKPLDTFADPADLDDPAVKRWAVARSFALTSWRGGLGQASCYDELLPAGPLVAAMEQLNATSALLCGADWPLVDPALADAVIERHLSAPTDMKLCFTQAPPGLAPVAAHIDLLRQLATNDGAGIGPVLGYNPQHPALDPISKDVNVAASPRVRDTYRRFIADTPRTAHHLAAVVAQLVAQLGSAWLTASADAIADAAATVELNAQRADPGRLPQQVTLELTPRRLPNGPITPQHFHAIDRPPLDTDAALRIIDQLEPDTALCLGGLGDALLHPQWRRIAEHAQPRVLSVTLDTDLLADAAHDPAALDPSRPVPPLADDTLAALADGPIDIVTVRLNADTAVVYEELMGVDAFANAMENLRRLHAARAATGQPHLPWIVPRLAKVTANLKDMETFFERWLQLVGSAVIEPFTDGAGLIPDLSPVPMHPPARVPCRQLGSRMTILSDGTVAQCDQDWLGRASLGPATSTPLLETWSRVGQRCRDHHAGRAAELT